MISENDTPNMFSFAIGPPQYTPKMSSSNWMEHSPASPTHTTIESNPRDPPLPPSYPPFHPLSNSYARPLPWLKPINGNMPPWYSTIAHPHWHARKWICPCQLAGCFEFTNLVLCLLPSGAQCGGSRVGGMVDTAGYSYERAASIAVAPLFGTNQGKGTKKAMY